MFAQDNDDWAGDDTPWTAELAIKSDYKEIDRIRHQEYIEPYLDYAFENGQAQADKIHLEWERVVKSVPDVTDRETIISLALMSSDAYLRTPDDGDWQTVDGYRNSGPYGWITDGLRGHVFANEDNSTIVIGIKGTSAKGISGDSGDTVINDKLNDNLLFSCCCARVGYMWTTVCDCYKSSYTCDQTCLEKEMVRKDRYYQATLDLYRNVTTMYPDSAVWVTGHSLGGSLSALLGRTFGLPAVTFEAVPELLAVKRLHLPQPPGLSPANEHIWHFGHTADPIYMGVCNGASSSCSIAGYAMETQCHSGMKCIYDVVTDKGWSVNLLNHRIRKVIDEVILSYNVTAQCVTPPPCHDCFNWKFVSDENDRGKRPHTSEISSPTVSPTGKPTCKRRNWLGRCIERNF